MRKWVALLVAAVVVVAVVVVVAAQRAQEEAHAADVAQWHQELQAWEEAQAKQLQPPEGPLLSDVVTGAAMTSLPSASSTQVADIDEMNAACTSLTAYAGAVRDAPGPPAAPAEADFTDEERQQFAQDLQALQTFRATIEPAADVIRRFCGTYPLLITAHTGSGVGGDQLIAQGLTAQCPLDELEEACDALQAAAAGQTPTAELDEEHLTQAISSRLTSAEQTISEAAAEFQAAVG